MLRIVNVTLPILAKNAPFFPLKLTAISKNPSLTDLCNLASTTIGSDLYLPHPTSLAMPVQITNMCPWTKPLVSSRQSQLWLPQSVAVFYPGTTAVSRGVDRKSCVIGAMFT